MDQVRGKPKSDHSGITMVRTKKIFFGQKVGNCMKSMKNIVKVENSKKVGRLEYLSKKVSANIGEHIWGVLWNGTMYGIDHISGSSGRIWSVLTVLERLWPALAMSPTKLSAISDIGGAIKSQSRKSGTSRWKLAIIVKYGIGYSSGSRSRIVDPKPVLERSWVALTMSPTK